MGKAGHALRAQARHHQRRREFGVPFLIEGTSTPYTAVLRYLEEEESDQLAVEHGINVNETHLILLDKLAADCPLKTQDRIRLPPDGAADTNRWVIHVVQEVYEGADATVTRRWAIGSAATY